MGVFMQQHIFLAALLLGGLSSLAFADAREDQLERAKRLERDREYRREDWERQEQEREYIKRDEERRRIQSKETIQDERRYQGI